MIDIHSHVLYDLDDGARTLEDSLAMVRMAAGHGTTDLVATPHANPAYRFEAGRIAEHLARLEEAAAGALRLHTGCDFHLSFDNIQDALLHPSKYTINHRNYLLVEFSDMLVFHNTSEIFDRLLEAGMIPVITHPERNGLLRQRIEKIAEWVAAGSRVQVTGQSLTGDFGRHAQQFSRDLLNRNLVHVIASDGHDCQRRPPVMDAAFQWLGANYSKELAKRLCIANPGAALTGEAMQIDPDPGARPSRKWYQVWR